MDAIGGGISADKAARHRQRKERFITGRYTILLLVLVGMCITVPLVDRREAGILAVKLLITTAMLACVLSSGQGRGTMLAAAILVVPGILGRWLPHFSTSPLMFASVSVMSAVFFAYIAVLIVTDVCTAKKVTFDAVNGAASAYMLLALVFAMLYSAVDVLIPESFKFAYDVVRPGDYYFSGHFMRMVYFSFITMSTTGYGDIVPVSGMARALAMLEAIFGQFYIAVLVARLVSLWIVHAHAGEPRD